MTEFLFHLLWDSAGGAGAMDSCYKLYSWISHTLLMLLLQILWKISQITDYLRKRSDEDTKSEMEFTNSPLNKESKLRRHIRSMSDVQSSTPCRIPFRLKKGLWSLSCDSDTRVKRVHFRYKYQDSSDSSDSCDLPKHKNIEHKIIKQSDSMRIL